MTPSRRSLTALAIALIAWASTDAQIQQAWPQWGGAGRNFTAADPGLTLQWPASGPPQRWRRSLGDGLSAVVTDGVTLYTQYRDGEQDVAIALRASDGATVWETRYAAPFSETCSQKLGPTPRSTPLLTPALLITVSAGGLVNALDRRTGSKTWSRDLAEAGTKVRPCGYSSSPLVHGSLVILPGAATGAVAFDMATGRTAWTLKEFEQSYSSPILVNVDGIPALVALTGTHIIGVNPKTGAVMWTHPHPAEFGANVSTPVWGDDGLLFVSSAYSGGSRVIRITRRGSQLTVDPVWHHQRVRAHFGNVVRIGNRVFTSSGDTGVAPLTAVDIVSGDTLWRSRAVGRAMILAVGSRLILLDEDGTLALATPTEAGLEVHASAEVLQGLTWTPPTLSGTVLFVRNRQELVALELGSVPSAPCLAAHQVRLPDKPCEPGVQIRR